MRKAWILVGLSLVVVGCKKKAKAGPEAGSGAVSASPAPLTSPVAGGGAVPALDLKPVAAKKTRAARKLNGEGLKLHKAKDFAGAQSKFAEALQSDPGYVMARYNLACAYNMGGDGPRGLAVLKEIKDAGCPACLGRMVRAREDSDWESQWQSAEFKALTEGVEIETGSVPKLATELEAAWRSGKLDGVKSMIGERSPVKVRAIGGGCDDTDPNCDATATVTGFDAVKAELAKHQSVEPAIKGVSCSKGCCGFEYVYDDEQPDAFMMFDIVQEACFSTDSGGVTTLSSIHFVNGGI